MCKRFDDWSSEIEMYCSQNDLSFEKLKNMVQSWGKDDLAFQFYDENCNSVKSGLGLLDETPMPLVLWVQKLNGKFVFKQTEYTKKYLA